MQWFKIIYHYLSYSVGWKAQLNGSLLESLLPQLHMAAVRWDLAWVSKMASHVGHVGHQTRWPDTWELTGIMFFRYVVLHVVSLGLPTAWRSQGRQTSHAMVGFLWAILDPSLAGGWPQRAQLHTGGYKFIPEGLAHWEGILEAHIMVSFQARHSECRLQVTNSYTHSEQAGDTSRKV